MLMSICRTCKRLDTCVPGHMDEFCLNYVKKPATNADRLRAKSDEELAEWLEEHCYQNGWLKWLRQEARDG